MMPIDADVVSRLREHRTLGSAPPSELEWLAAHGEVRRFEPGEAIARKGEMLDSLYVVFSGRFSITVDRGLGPRKVMEWRAGDVSGLLPYSRMITPPGDSLIDQPTDTLTVHRDRFPDLVRECPTVTAALVHSMLDRARQFTSSALQDEKMVSLGKLAAGLAHELNNPASAAARSATRLAHELGEVEAASRALGAASLTGAQLALIDRTRETCVSAAPRTLTPIERADREDAIVTWLETHGVDPSVAPSLADTGAAIGALDALGAELGNAALNAALRWIAAGCAARSLAADLASAATRIHKLVAAVKNFTYMDQTQAREPIDVTPSLHDAVALLAHKARRKSVGITVTVEPNLPRVRAIGGDLNQMWMNLIDNALDAADEAGQVSVEAARRLDYVVVRVIDDGVGIRPEDHGRIFDTFFTTKPVGEGTGLGLDIVNRLVRRNDGDIDFESQPGRTEFRVTLPIASG